MDISAIRFANYIELKKQFRKKEDMEGIPERGELTRFSEIVGISPRYLSHVNNGRKNIGHAMARRLEEALKLAHGWMDMDHIEGATMPMDKLAKEFGSLAMRLYRQDPEGVRAALMEYMETKMLGEK